MNFNSLKIGEDETFFYILSKIRAIGICKTIALANPAFPRFQFTTLFQDPRPRCYLPPNFGFSLKALRILRFNKEKLRIRRPIIYGF